MGCRKSFDRFKCLRWLGRVFNRFDDRIEALEFGPSHLGTELPVDFGLELVAWAFPGGDFLAQGVDRRNAAIQTLASEHGQLALGHIEPTAMLGGVVQLELASDPPGFVRGQNPVQGGGGMGIEVIQDQSDALGGREVVIDQQAHLLSKILLGPPVRDVDVTPTAQGLDEQKQIGGAFPFIFRVIARWLARAGRQGMAGFAGQLDRAFVEAHLRIPGIFRLRIQVQHLLHMPDIVGTHTGNTPFLTLPGFEVVFFYRSKLRLGMV